MSRTITQPDPRVFRCPTCLIPFASRRRARKCQRRPHRPCPRCDRLYPKAFRYCVEDGRLLGDPETWDQTVSRRKWTRMGRNLVKLFFHPH